MNTCTCGVEDGVCNSCLLKKKPRVQKRPEGCGCIQYQNVSDLLRSTNRVVKL